MLARGSDDVTKPDTAAVAETETPTIEETPKTELADSVADNESTATPDSGTKVSWYEWPSDAPAPAIAPFDAPQAKKHQEEWAAYLKLPVEYTNSIGMKFRLIPPGEFLMGSTAAEIEAALKDVGEDKQWQECIKSEAPQHKVILTQAIYLGVNEVTQKEYEAVMKATPSHFASSGAGKEAVANLDAQNHPVEVVSWNDAAEFCAKLSQKEELKPFCFRARETITPLEGTGYRLPIEAEWEFACRAGTTTKFWIGDKDDELVRAGWFGGNSGGRAHAARELTANPLGLSDMNSNVWEWVEDAWDPAYFSEFAEKPSTNPSGTSSAGSQRVIRGANYSGTASFCRSAIRNVRVPSSRHYYLGFRLVLVADAVREALKSEPNHAPSANASRRVWPADAPKSAIAPFDAAQAKQHQDVWAKYLNVPVAYKNRIGMKFVLIPPGEYLRRSSTQEIDAAISTTQAENWKIAFRSESPRHQVVLTRPFYVAVHETTQEKYEKRMSLNPSYFSSGGGGQKAVAGIDTRQFPVENLSQIDAAEFCTKLSRRETFATRYRTDQNGFTEFPKGIGYQLPTEAEWEFACHAGTTTPYYS